MPTIPHNRIPAFQLAISRPDGVTWEDLSDYLESVEVELGDVGSIGTGNQGGDSVVRWMRFVLRNDRTFIPNWSSTMSQSEDYVIGNEADVIGNESSNVSSVINTLFGKSHSPYQGDSFHLRDQNSVWNWFQGSFEPLLDAMREVVLRVAIRENGDYTQESGTTQKIGVLVGVGAGTLQTFDLGKSPILVNSEKIFIDGIQTSNYTIDYNAGTMETDETGNITANFTYYFNLFAGYLGDSIKSSPKASSIICTCRDYAGLLQDAYILDHKKYGNEDGSITAETVIQQIMADNITDPDTLNVPAPSDFAITDYPVQYISVWDALQNIASQKGWFLGYRHNDQTNAWELNFIEPPRDKDKTNAEWTLTAEDDFYTSEIDISVLNVRNKIRGIYREKFTKSRETVEVFDQTSIDRYRLRQMQIEEANTSLIDTKEEMLVFLNSALVDLKDMSGIVRIEMPLLPQIDLFHGIILSDPRTSTTLDFFGVQSVRHRIDFKSKRFRTEVVGSGKVVGGKMKWLRMQTRPGAGKPISFPEQSKLTEPPDVKKFNATQDGLELLFSWEPIVSEPATYEIRRGTSWETGQVLAKSVQSDTYKTRQILKGTHAYFIKAIDLFGNESINAAQSSVTVNFLPGLVDVLFHDEMLVIDGIMDNVIDLSDESGNRFGLRHLYTDQDFAISIQDISNEILIESPVISGEGTYETLPIDLGASLSVHAITEISGTNEPSTSRILEISYSDDNVVYSSWELFNGGQYNARYFKFRVTLISNGNKNIIEEFKIELDAPEYSQRGNNISVPVGGLVINFSQTFNIIPSIILTAIGDVSARLIAQSESSFTAKVVNNSGTDVGGTINWTATGY